MNNKLLEKRNEMYKYIDVTVDKDFALEVIPFVELVMLNTDTIKKIARFELSPLKKWYINHCDTKKITTRLYKNIIEESMNITRYKVLTLLDALYDIINEDTPRWKARWKIKEYYHVEYNKVKSDLLRVDSTSLEPKPEYIEKYKKNEKISKQNVKRYKKCEKWRNSNLKFYKKILKIVNS